MTARHQDDTVLAVLKAIENEVHHLGVVLLGSQPEDVLTVRLDVSWGEGPER